MVEGDIIDFLNKNATLLYSVVIVASMAYAGLTVFAKWIAGKFLAKFDKRIVEHKQDVQKAVKAQEDLLYDTSTKFDVAITRLTTEFAAVGKTVTNVESEVRDIKHDVHDISNKVNDQIVRSAVKSTEIDNKMMQNQGKLDNLEDKFSNFMTRQDTFSNRQDTFANRQDNFLDKQDSRDNERRRRGVDNNNNNKKEKRDY